MKLSVQRMESLIIGLSLIAGLCVVAGNVVQAAPSVVKLEKKGEKVQLIRNGQPYMIKGAGGDGSKPELLKTGANSFRTWGADGIDDKLDEAEKLSLTVTIGIWLGHKEHGFDYNNAQQVADQLANAKRAIDRYKNHPALLMWGIGNEMEIGFPGDYPQVWKAIEEIAAYAKKVDPNHPTMTVVAEIGGNKVENINKYCPSIDVIGINTYAGAQSIAERYVKAGGVKPYVLTEFGPPGTWEWGKNAWGVVPEFTSTEKANWYADAWNKTIADKPLALGGYAFTWGNKQEATATWYGMLLPNGERLAAVDAMQQIWSGKPPVNRVPEIRELKAVTPDRVKGGETVRASLVAVDPEKDPLKVEWILQQDPATYSVGGATEAVPPVYPDAIVKADNSSVEVKMPRFGGAYRLFAKVHDNHNGAAIGNVPLFVDGNEKPPPPSAQKAHLPLAVYSEAGAPMPFIPSGYMGNVAAIKMDNEWKENPHSGKSSIKVQYTANDNWGGVVWQAPANDWGEQPGGWDLTGAQKLSFWARGENGGEKVGFAMGVLGRDKPFYDTAKVEQQNFILTKEWKQYEFSLNGSDLSRIKTGFMWVVGAHGQPFTFYLDDIVYSADGAAGGTQSTPAENIPVAVAGPGQKVTLPYTIYADKGGNSPFIPSGYMGNAGAIKMADDDITAPHSGKTAIKVQYTANDNWGGVVWQAPANDWGDQPGGVNLSGAKKLSFWAKGEKGGEEVSFSFGLIDRNKKYYDTGSGKLEKVKLTNEWKEYSIDIANQDLSRIKTGFVWVLAGNGAPMTFYLDDIRYE